MSAALSMLLALVALHARGSGARVEPERGVAAPPSEPRSFHEFLPSRHGFAFTNSFAGSPLGNTGLPAFDRLAKGAVNGRFGLCGGMSSAAADLFLARRDPPTLTTPPVEGTAWFAYLRRRQVDSLGPGLGIAQQFARAMTAPDRGLAGVQTSTLLALHGIVRDLHAGQPVVLGMVLTGGDRPGKLWENHQVLAYGVAHAGDTTAIRIYDPNYPRRDDVVIASRLCVSGFMPVPQTIVPVPVAGVVTTWSAHRRTRHVRGLLAIPYEPVVPGTDLK